MDGPGSTSVCRTTKSVSPNRQKLLLAERRSNWQGNGGRRMRCSESRPSRRWYPRLYSAGRSRGGVRSFRRWKYVPTPCANGEGRRRRRRNGYSGMPWGIRGTVDQVPNGETARSINVGFGDPSAELAQFPYWPEKPSPKLPVHKDGSLEIRTPDFRTCGRRTIRRRRQRTP